MDIYMVYTERNKCRPVLKSPHQTTAASSQWVNEQTFGEIL